MRRSSYLTHFGKQVLIGVREIIQHIVLRVAVPASLSVRTWRILRLLSLAIFINNFFGVTDRTRSVGCRREREREKIERERRERERES